VLQALPLLAVLLEGIAALGSVVEGNAALGSVAGGRVVGSRDDSASVCFEQVLRKGKDGVACRAS
jgi:hypothetical protein